MKGFSELQFLIVFVITLTAIIFLVDYLVVQGTLCVNSFFCEWSNRYSLLNQPTRAISGKNVPARSGRSWVFVKRQKTTQLRHWLVNIILCDSRHKFVSIGEQDVDTLDYHSNKRDGVLIYRSTPNVNAVYKRGNQSGLVVITTDP